MMITVFQDGSSQVVSQVISCNLKNDFVMNSIME